VQRVWHLQWHCWRPWPVAARVLRAIGVPRGLKAPRAMPARWGPSVRQVRSVLKGKKGQPARRARASGSSSPTACRVVRCNVRTTRSSLPPIAGRPATRRSTWAKEPLPVVQLRALRIRRSSLFASARRNSDRSRGGGIIRRSIHLVDPHPMSGATLGLAAPHPAFLQGRSGGARNCRAVAPIAAAFTPWCKRLAAPASRIAAVRGA